MKAVLIEYRADEGYVPEATGTIAEATARIASAPRALILLDLMLPYRSGWDFCANEARDPMLASIPVLVISAASQDRLLEAKELGANAFLSKPFSSVSRVRSAHPSRFLCGGAQYRTPRSPAGPGQ
jgi:CheY-like chemotaxis protein